MIYFIYDPKNDVVKIGKSNKNNLYTRFASIQTGNVVKLELLGVMEGYTEKELELHELFSKDRVRGEWFAYTDCLKNYISSNILEEYKAKCPKNNPKTKKQYHKRKRDKLFSKLDEILTLDKNSYILVSDLKDFLIQEGITTKEGNSTLSATKIVKYFSSFSPNVRIKNKRINTVIHRVVFGLAKKTSYE